MEPSADQSAAKSHACERSRTPETSLQDRFVTLWERLCSWKVASVDKDTLSRLVGSFLKAPHSWNHADLRFDIRPSYA